MTTDKRRDNRRNTAIRIPEGTYQRLKKAAEERDLAMNFLITKAIEEFLDNLIPVEELTYTRRPIPSEQ